MYECELIMLTKNLRWSSDWNGDEVGYPEVDVVGLYTERLDDDNQIIYDDNGNGVVAIMNYYIDVSCDRVLEKWVELEEE